MKNKEQECVSFLAVESDLYPSRPHSNIHKHSANSVKGWENSNADILSNFKKPEPTRCVARSFTPISRTRYNKKERKASSKISISKENSKAKYSALKNQSINERTPFIFKSSSYGEKKRKAYFKDKDYTFSYDSVGQSLKRIIHVQSILPTKLNKHHNRNKFWQIERREKLRKIMMNASGLMSNKIHLK